MHQLEIDLERHEKARKLFVRLFWVFFLAADFCFFMTVVFDFAYGKYGWISMTLAFVFESRQQSAKGWISGVGAMATAIRTGGARIEMNEEEEEIAHDSAR